MPYWSERKAESRTRGTDTARRTRRNANGYNRSHTCVCVFCLLTPLSFPLGLADPARGGGVRALDVRARGLFRVMFRVRLIGALLHGIFMVHLDSCVRPNTAEPEPKAHTTPPRTRACTREGVLSGLATHEPLLTSHLRRCMQRSPSRTHMTAVRLVSPPLCRRNVSTEHPSS